MRTPSARLRRGAWEGSRAVAMIAAAFVAAGLGCAIAAAPAAAYPCEASGADAPAAWDFAPRPTGKCSPAKVREPASRPRKKGSVGGLTVFVLAVGGALLIPIGRNGLRRGDPFGHDRAFYERKSSTT